jgi:hypothetical protein
MPWRSPAEPEPGKRAELEAGENPTIGKLSRVVGFLMIVEGVLCAVASLPFLVFGGLGVFGVAAGVAQGWLGFALIGVARADPKVAAASSVAAGAAIAFVVFMVMVFVSCNSIVNCGSGSVIPHFVVAGLVAGLNLCGAALFWRRLRPAG